MADQSEDDVERNPFAAPESDLQPEQFDDEDNDRRKRRHRIIEAGDVVSTSWEIFKNEMGIVIAGWLVITALNYATSLPQTILDVVATALRSQGDDGTADLLQIIGFAFVFVGLAAQVFFSAGMNRFLLNVTRGDARSIGDLFSGGKYFWRLLGASIVYGLMVMAGTLACIVPGILLALMFSPFGFLLVDEDLPGIECIGKSRDVTKDNLGALLLIFLAAFGINILGVLALCVGVFFTAPLTMLFMAVAYCRMTGQRTAADRQRRRAED
ncbi:MAG: hypothetical protein JSS49_30530 [Planctomycetes bacterium]|nr:hypothetical protein [Planctomycetota bacterium]